MQIKLIENLKKYLSRHKFVIICANCVWSTLWPCSDDLITFAHKIFHVKSYQWQWRKQKGIAN